jgi:hypothetical protein
MVKGGTTIEDLADRLDHIVTGTAVESQSTSRLAARRNIDGKQKNIRHYEFERSPTIRGLPRTLAGDSIRGPL